MKTKFCLSLVVMLGIALVASSSAFASGWGWDRDAGAKARGEFGTSPKSKSSRTYSYRSYSYRPGPSAYWQQPYVAARQAYSYQPAAPAAVKVGDTIVAPAAVPLKVGDKVVATVPQGQRIAVSSVEGPWVGTSIEQNGRTIGGWALASELAGASPQYPAAIPYYAARPVWSGGGCR